QASSPHWYRSVRKSDSNPPTARNTDATTTSMIFFTRSVSRSARTNRAERIPKLKSTKPYCINGAPKSARYKGNGESGLSFLVTEERKTYSSAVAYKTDSEYSRTSWA